MKFCFYRHFASISGCPSLSYNDFGILEKFSVLFWHPGPSRVGDSPEGQNEEVNEQSLRKNKKNWSRFEEKWGKWNWLSYINLWWLNKFTYFKFSKTPYFMKNDVLPFPNVSSCLGLPIVCNLSGKDLLNSKWVFPYLPNFTWLKPNRWCIPLQKKNLNIIQLLRFVKMIPRGFLAIQISRQFASISSVQKALCLC